MVSAERVPHADGDVDAFEDQIHQAILEAQVDAQLGVLRHQRAAVAARRGARPNVTGALTLSTPSSPSPRPTGLRLLDLAEDAQAALVVAPAGRR